MSDSGPRAAMVSKHSSKMEDSELLELRGLDVTEERERGRPLDRGPDPNSSNWVRLPLNPLVKNDQRRGDLGSFGFLSLKR